MKSYLITMPFAGSVTMSVDADNEEHAKGIFYDRMGDFNMIDWKGLHKIDAEIDEWDFYQKITSGNVLHVPCNEMSIEEQ